MGKAPNPTGKGGFQKGQSGNLKGRPPVDKEIQMLALTKSVQAFETIAHLMIASDDEKIRMQAADKILERAYGRPKQSIDVDMVAEVTNVISDKPLTAEEWAQKYARKV